MDILDILRAALQQALGPQAIVFALAAIGLNIHFGYTGLLNFGQAGFVAVGAYGLAVSVVTFGAPFWLGITMAIVAPLLLAVVLGVPTLRLRADYLAIVTIAAAEVLRFVFGSVEMKDTFGGSNGLNGFARPFQEANPYNSGIDLGFISFGRGDLWSLTVGWILVALCCVLVWALMRSPWGRVLRSIREDEDAVRSLGKNVFAYKMQALVIGGLIGAVAGFVFALSRANVQPDTFSTDFTFYFYVVLILGGAARIFGPVLGAALFWFLYTVFSQGLSQAITADLISPEIINQTQVGPLVFFLLGLGMVLLLIFRPQGILGNKRELMLDVR